MKIHGEFGTRIEGLEIPLLRLANAGRNSKENPSPRPTVLVAQRLQLVCLFPWAVHFAAQPDRVQGPALQGNQQLI